MFDLGDVGGTHVDQDIKSGTLNCSLVWAGRAAATPFLTKRFDRFGEKTGELAHLKYRKIGEFETRESVNFLGTKKIEIRLSTQYPDSGTK